MQLRSRVLELLPTIESQAANALVRAIKERLQVHFPADMLIGKKQLTRALITIEPSGF